MKTTTAMACLLVLATVTGCNADQSTSSEATAEAARFPNSFGIRDEEWLSISDDALRARTNLDAIAQSLTTKSNPALTDLYLVGLAYDWGWGLPADPSEAAKWYQRAIAQQEPRSMNNYGFLLARGRGVQQDDGRAIDLYRAAAQAGNIFSMANYANRLRDGRGIQADSAQAFIWFKRASDGGNVCANVDLAEFYLAGGSVARDLVEARRLAEAGMECDDSTQRQRASDLLSTL